MKWGEVLRIGEIENGGKVKWTAITLTVTAKYINRKEKDFPREEKQT